MIKYFFNERFEELVLPKGAVRRRYAISNYGRVVSFEDEVQEGRLLRCSQVQGYTSLKINLKNQPITNKSYFVHKLVAEFFVKRPSPEHSYVLHRDFSKTNNIAVNLFWATEAEKNAHYNKNPKVIELRTNRKLTPVHEGLKLTSTDVMRIKKKIFDPERKTRMRLIAKQFKISEMQLYRIRSGENWSHVKVDVLGKRIGVAKEFEALLAQQEAVAL